MSDALPNDCNQTRKTMLKMRLTALKVTGHESSESDQRLAMSHVLKCEGRDRCVAFIKRIVSEEDESKLQARLRQLSSV